MQKLAISKEVIDTDAKPRYRYFLVAGGTGGHIFPALAVAEKLKNNAILLTDRRFRNYGNRNIEIPYSIFAIASTTKKIRFLLSLIPTTIKSIFLLLRHKPKVMIAFGGYPCIPHLIGAVLTRTKIVLHESNTMPGKVNWLFARVAEKILFGLPMRKPILHSIQIGNPLTQDVRPVPHPRNNVLHILVIGGSQGSNVLGLELANMLLNISDDRKLKITHQCRPNHESELRTLYEKHGIESEVSHFFNDIPTKIANSDIVISRGGAISISEILTVGRPAILIPNKHAKDDHQRYNAEFVESSNMGVMIKESELTHNSLSKAVEKLLTNLDFYIQHLASFNHQFVTEEIADLLQKM